MVSISTVMYKLVSSCQERQPTATAHISHVHHVLLPPPPAKYVQPKYPACTLKVMMQVHTSFASLMCAACPAAPSQGESIDKHGLGTVMLAIIENP